MRREPKNYKALQPIRHRRACSLLEATTGFEPVNGGFADPCLTTWLRRHSGDFSILTKPCQRNNTKYRIQ